MSLVEGVLEYLSSHRIHAAMIGGAALAVYGVARATIDIDFLTDDARVLDRRFWDGFKAAPPDELRRGDADDPFAGIVRWTGGASPIDLLVGRGPLTSKMLARRIEFEIDGVRTPVVDAPDLLLLKLAAGGPQDDLDVKLLLRSDSGKLRAALIDRLTTAPPELRAAWERLGEP